MTQSAAPSHHRRSPSSSHAIASKNKSSRPALHRRGTSALNPSISKLGAGHARGASKSEDIPEFDMAASFLNFCAMCEKQITVPNNALLYCSESCRRKDSCKPLSASWPSMSPTSTSTYTTTPPTSPPLSPRTIVAPMTPTRVQSVPSIRIPSDLHDSRTDLDPTEWKPVITATHGRGHSTSSSASLASSDAWNYLSQFHGGNEAMLARRPSSNRSTTSLPALVGGAGAGYMHTPATPSTVASSFSSTASDDLGSMYGSALAMQQRPLPPRHNPCFSGGATATKGVELVVPHIAVVSANGSISSPNGSLFHGSDSTVWEDGPCEKTSSMSAPITMKRASRA
ncbi:hypothetical protein N7474_007226 [Penicillium riverlandense]|uniref:uncharacterized protein n=1 Tax=Penicillium riverlandense TaxID=1903569 RepID=UPI002548CDA4|nr:uncharacterized protein N7474_007226 [Penicillium riverlandense]KAJ5815449.1 hypothetical protein N7474_007226 [Penicillium riverlandense]